MLFVYFFPKIVFVFSSHSHILMLFIYFFVFTSHSHIRCSWFWPCTCIWHSGPALHARSGDALVSSAGNPAGNEILLDRRWHLEYWLHLRGNDHEVSWKWVGWLVLFAENRCLDRFYSFPGKLCSKEIRRLINFLGNYINFVCLWKAMYENQRFSLSLIDTDLPSVLPQNFPHPGHTGRVNVAGGHFLAGFQEQFPQMATQWFDAGECVTEMSPLAVALMVEFCCNRTKCSNWFAFDTPFFL